jgi:beta-glucosidase
LNKSTFRNGEVIEVSVEVKNKGKVAGKEVVHLFSSDLYASKITPDVKRLRRFEKISLAAGERKTVRFELTADDLKYFDATGKAVIEAGEFELIIGELTQTIELVD